MEEKPGGVDERETEEALSKSGIKEGKELPLALSNLLDVRLCTTILIDDFDEAVPLVTLVATAPVMATKRGDRSIKIEGEFVERELPSGRPSCCGSFGR